MLIPAGLNKLLGELYLLSYFIDVDSTIFAWKLFHKKFSDTFDDITIQLKFPLTIKQSNGMELTSL